LLYARLITSNYCDGISLCMTTRGATRLLVANTLRGARQYSNVRVALGLGSLPASLLSAGAKVLISSLSSAPTHLSILDVWDRTA